MNKHIRIGTRESQLAVWQANLVKSLLEERGYASVLVYITSQGDADTVTPLYELGVQGIFTRSLDAALINDRIDIAVHSLKDVPVLPAEGIRHAAVLKRGSYKDTLVWKGDPGFMEDPESMAVIATSSIRRKAQWLHRYPRHCMENLRGNVGTRLQKLGDQHWNGAIFAAAGLERTGLRPEQAADLDWMLPAPAQGAITVVCRTSDTLSFEACHPLHDFNTGLCTGIERDFLRALSGGCSTPVSALAEIVQERILFTGNICSPDGRKKIEIRNEASISRGEGMGKSAAGELLKKEGAGKIMQNIIHAAR